MTKKKKAAKAAEVPVFIKQSTVKEFISGLGFRSSGDVFDSLNSQIGDLLAKGTERCEANGRSTVRGSDI